MSLLILFNTKNESTSREIVNPTREVPSEEKTIHVAGTLDWNPYQMVDENNNAYGMTYDLLDKIFEDTDFTLVRDEALAFRRQLKELETRGIDILAGLYYTDERNEKYLYTEAFSVDEVCIFIRKDTIIDFNSYDDLSDRIGLIPDGASFGETFEENKHLLKFAPS